MEDRDGVAGQHLHPDLAQHPRPRRVDEFEAAHPEDHDGHVADGPDVAEDAVGGGEEQGPLEAEDRDALIAIAEELREWNAREWEKRA